MAEETEKKPFTKVPNSLARCGKKLSMQAKVLMVYLLSNTAKFNAESLSYRTMMHYTGLSRNTVYKALYELIEAGLVIADKKTGKSDKGTGYIFWSLRTVDADEVFPPEVNTSQVNTSQVNTSQVNTSQRPIEDYHRRRSSSSRRPASSTPSTEDHSQRTTTAAPSAVSGGEASGGAGGAVEPSSDVLDDVYQEFAERHREGEFDRFLRYNRQRRWSMGVYDAAHEWLSKERPDRSRKPKAAGSGERLPESVAGAMEQVRAMCGRLAGVNEALARKAEGWFKLAGICCTANPGNTKAPAKLMENAKEFLRRCPLFLDGEDAGFGEFVDSLVTK